MAAPLSHSLRRESWVLPAASGPGVMRLRLVNSGPTAIDDVELAFTTVVQLTPEPSVRLVERTSGFHVVAPPAGLVLGPGEVWMFAAHCGHRPRHANDGPTGAYVVLADGSTVALRSGAMGRVAGAWRRPSDRAPAPVWLTSTGSTVERAWALTA